MLKLLLCLLVGTLTAASLLALRQQRLELNHQANLLHNQIENCQAKLWNQQLQIAVYTAPNAIAQTVGSADLKLAPESAGEYGIEDWTGTGKEK
jgi:cell division protein FtsL